MTIDGMTRVRRLAGAAALLGTLCPCAAAATDAATTKPDRQTLLIIRPAEKPPNGLGQLSCRGLNRALALPSVIERKFGRPDAIFAPSPKPKQEGTNAWYDYVRPLATIEPTAIRFGLPVYADYPFDGIDQLQDAMNAPRFKKAAVLIVWEPEYAARFVRSFVTALGGDMSVIPAEWKGDAGDAIWKMTVERKGDAATFTFASDKEGLDDPSDLCPNSAAPPLAQPSPFR